MTEPTEKTGLVAREPVLVSTFVAWLFSVAGTFIVGHTDLINNSQWSSLSTTLVPIIAAVVLAGLGWLTRKVVTPAWKQARTVGIQLGLNDEQLDQIQQKVSETVADAAESYIEDLPGVPDQTLREAVGHDGATADPGQVKD